ncbi:MAG: PAS domain S-box protein [Hydrogenophaga sp.]|nr:PAS domain S-box protein [Hydrogenophaga sp.]
MTESFEINDLTLWLGVLEKIVDSSTNMVVITDAERRIKWVNARYTQVTGWTLHECVNKRPREVLHGPETSPETLATIGTLLRAGEPVKGVELVNYRKSGEIYRVSLDIEAIRDSGGRICAYLSMQSDITDQHQRHLDSIELKRRLDVAQRLARLGRIETDPETGQPYWSSEVFRILGMVPDDRPRGFDDLLAHAYKADVLALQLDRPWQCDTGQEVDIEFRVEGARGMRWIRCQGIPRAEGGRYLPPQSWLVQDISLFKSRLEEKRLLNERLNELVQERTQKLEESNQALEDFSYALSHDLRTPLRHVAGFSELLAEAVRRGEVGECLRYCEKISQSAHKMQELIEGMLAFAKAGRQGLKLVPIPLSSVIPEMIAAVEGTAGGKPVHWEVDPELPVVQGDPVLLREVWLNLLDNAVKYSSGRERITVRVGWLPRDEGWEFFVKDNGAGFDPRHAHKLFGMFQRLHRDDQFKGTGVGLALVRRIVESHGGRIWALSTPGEGAAFHFLLPFCAGLDDPSSSITPS